MYTLTVAQAQDLSMAAHRDGMEAVNQGYFKDGYAQAELVDELDVLVAKARVRNADVVLEEGTHDGLIGLAVDYNFIN